MSENKKNLNMIIIGALMVSTIGMTAVSGVFIYSNFQNKQNSEYFELNYEEAYQNYLDAQDDYSETLNDLHATQEDLSQAEGDLEVALLDLQNAENLLQEALDDLQEAEDELQLIQDNTDFSGSFYILSQSNYNFDSSATHIKWTRPYSDYFFHRLTLEHPSHSASSLWGVAQNVAGYCRPDSVSTLAVFIRDNVDYPSDDECVIDGLLTFCQDRGDFEECIHYVSDGVDDFSKYPIETLCEGCGDCEDKSILFASLVRALDYDVRIFIMEGHCCVGVKLDSSPTHADGTWGVTFSDGKYYNCETTGYGWLIGDLPVEYQSEPIYSYPVL
ncbi:MAG: hypothetical protein ACTSQ5_09350 [Promethearchaeota archaeon]